MNDEQKDIEAGKGAEQLLESETVKAAFDKLRGLYYAEFQSAAPDKAISIQSRARGLEDIQNELRVIADRGKQAQRQRDQRQAADTRRK